LSEKNPCVQLSKFTKVEKWQLVDSDLIEIKNMLLAAFSTLEIKMILLIFSDEEIPDSGYKLNIINLVMEKTQTDKIFLNTLKSQVERKKKQIQNNQEIQHAELKKTNILLQNFLNLKNNSKNALIHSPTLILQELLTAIDCSFDITPYIPYSDSIISSSLTLIKLIQRLRLINQEQLQNLQNLIEEEHYTPILQTEALADLQYVRDSAQLKESEKDKDLHIILIDWISFKLTRPGADCLRILSNIPDLSDPTLLISVNEFSFEIGQLFKNTKLITTEMYNLLWILGQLDSTFFDSCPIRQQIIEENKAADLQNMYNNYVEITKSLITKMKKGSSIEESFPVPVLQKMLTSNNISLHHSSQATRFLTQNSNDFLNINGYLEPEFASLLVLYMLNYLQRNKLFITSIMI